MIKIYRVNNGGNLTIDEETVNANNSFAPSYVHLRDDDGSYVLVLMYPDVDNDYTLMGEDDPEYDEIMEWVKEEGFVERMFDPEITGSVH